MAWIQRVRCEVGNIYKQGNSESKTELSGKKRREGGIAVQSRETRTKRET